MKRIELYLAIIAACAVIQTVWFLGEKVLSKAVSTAIASSYATDVNILSIGGKSIRYAEPIKVEVVK